MEKVEKKTTEIQKNVKEFARDTSDQIKSNTEKMKIMEENLEELKNKCNKLERFSRRNNIRIIGRKVGKGENCISTVDKILHEKFGLTHVKIERAHPDGPTKNSPDGTPQHILVKLNSYQDKVSIMKVARTKLKAENFYFTDDLTGADLQEKRKWRENVKQAYEQGVKCRFYNGYWRDGKGKPVTF